MAKLWLSYSGFWQNSDFFLKSCNFQCMQYLKLNTFKRIQCTNEYIKYIDFCGPGTTILTGHERKWCYIFHQTTVTPTEFSCRKLVLYCVKSEDFEASKCGGRQYAWRVPSSETPRSAYLKKKKKTRIDMPCARDPTSSSFTPAISFLLSTTVMYQYCMNFLMHITWHL